MDPYEQHLCNETKSLLSKFFEFVLLLKYKLGYSWGRFTPIFLVLPILETSDHVESISE